MRTFWVHLVKAGLITGIDPDAAWTGTITYGVEFPEAPVGGGFGVSSITTTGFTGNAFQLRSTPISYSGMEIEGDEGAVLPAVAAQIDRKIDDGLGGSGDVRGWPYLCYNTGTGAYYESAGTKDCNMFFKAAM